MNMEDCLPRRLSGVCPHVEAIDGGIGAFQVMPTLLQQCFHGVSLRLIKIEVVRDMAFWQDEDVSLRYRIQVTNGVS